MYHLPQIDEIAKESNIWPHELVGFKPPVEIFNDV